MRHRAGEKREQERCRVTAPVGCISLFLIILLERCVLSVRAWTARKEPAGLFFGVEGRVVPGGSCSRYLGETDALTTQADGGAETAAAAEPDTESANG